jgi:outer membrane protein OmpA-like peptidoglycan-associated protein
MSPKRNSSALALAALLLASCSTWNNTGKGGAVGVGVGGTLGGIIGKQSGNTTVGILIGAALGGTAGAAVGHYMDKQAAEIRDDLKNAKVERIGEGIKITFASGILFDTDSAVVQRSAQSNIADLSKTLNKYPDTEIVIQGYTDSTGSPQYNLALSEKRADAVASYLKSEGVKTNRIGTGGFGSENPIADNSTIEGRRANRRVEVAIFANDRLKKAANQGQL